MTDADTDTDSKTDDSDTDVKPEAPPKPVESLPELEHLTPRHLADLERKLRDEIAELHAGDKEEREALKQELAELREFKDKQEKANADRDRVKESQSTMVLPPTDIPPQQPNPTPRPVDPQTGKVERRRMHWW